VAIDQQTKRTLDTIRRFKRPVDTAADRALVKIYGISPKDLQTNGWVIDDRLRLIMLIPDKTTGDELDPILKYPNFVDFYKSEYTGLKFLVLKPIDRKFEEVIRQCNDLRTEWMRSHNSLP
jgi:hypothetical protein